MDIADRNYFMERAEAELDLGNAASHRGTAHAHYRMADFYLDRATGDVANDD